MSRSASRGPAWNDPACEVIAHRVVMFDENGQPPRGPLDTVGAPGDTLEHEGKTYRWHLGKWMKQEPQTGFPADGRCRCGECGGIALIPIGTIVSMRGRSVRVAAWSSQDCWHVPCMDAEGGVVVARDMLDGRAYCTLAEARVARVRTTELADAIAAQLIADVRDARERERLAAKLVTLRSNAAAFAALADRLAAGATGDAARLNPDLVATEGDTP